MRLSTILFFLTMFSVSVDACAEPTLGEIIVRAQSPRGAYIVCRESACEGVLNNLIANNGYILLDQEMVPTEADSRFCTDLMSAKPAGCSSGVYSAPGWDPMWSPGDCHGHDGWIEMGVAEDPTSWNIQNINEPQQGFSFLAACQEINTCYAQADFTQGFCNDNLADNLATVCGSHSSCSTRANAYVAAASSTSANAAHTSLAQTMACAKWNYSMSENGCQ